MGSLYILVDFNKIPFRTLAGAWKFLWGEKVVGTLRLKSRRAPVLGTWNGFEGLLDTPPSTPPSVQMQVVLWATGQVSGW